MTGPKGNSEFCFPETLNVPRSEAEGNINEITYYLVSSHWIYLYPFIHYFVCHFQFPASNYRRINAATATTTVSFICMAITTQYCKSVGHTGPTAEKLGQSEKRTSLLASSTGARSEKHSGREKRTFSRSQWKSQWKHKPWIPWQNTGNLLGLHSQ